jgi:hypothetical protein
MAVSMLLAPPVGATAATTHISRVVFSGTSDEPVVTISGSGFGAKPPADPAISPAKAGRKYDSTCRTQPLQGNGKDGRDFGATALGVGWGTSAPSGYSAGVYVPGSYLDCIGLIVERYSATKIVLVPGCQYRLYSPITSGDDYLVEVKGTTHRGRVTFG